MSETVSNVWSCTAVRCWASSRAAERPLSFLLGENEIKVRAVLATWREPDYLYFKVETDDGRIYVLRHHEYEDLWQVKESRQN